MADRSSEIRPLTGLRGPLALVVVFYHFYRGHIPGAIPLLSALVDRGFFAVGVFFVISGFILTVVYAGRDLRPTRPRHDFWRARFARIYPVYALSLAISFAAQWPDSAAALTTRMGLLHVALAVSLLNAVSHYGMFYLNWAAWSLSVEALFYLAFPWLHAGVSRVPVRHLVGLGVAVWLACLAFPALYTWLDPDHLGRPLHRGDEVPWSWYLKFSPITHAGAFLWGMVAGEIYVRYPARLSSATPSWRSATVLCASLVVALAIGSRHIALPWLYTDVLSPLYALVVLLLASGGNLASCLLASAPVHGLGRASYAIYILHVPLFFVFAAFVPDMWDKAPCFWRYLATLIAVSALVYRFVEEPARRWIRRSNPELRPLGGG